jgi:DNA-binding transcriptional MerR regulator
MAAQKRQGKSGARRGVARADDPAGKGVAERSGTRAAGQAERLDAHRRELRAEELAERSGITVQLLRSYQSKGLLPPPRHEGRVAWYGPVHEHRLDLIRDLKARGYSLRMIAEALHEDQGALSVDDATAAPLGLRDVAEASGLPPEMIRSLEASHVLRPHRIGRAYRYTDADVRAVRRVLTLLGVGLPLEDFLAIAEPQLATGDQLATQAVEAWDEHVCSRIRALELEPADEARRTVASLRMLVAAVSELVAYNVERAVLNAAQAHVAVHDSPAVRDAVEHEALRRHPDAAATIG